MNRPPEQPSPQIGCSSSDREASSPPVGFLKRGSAPPTDSRRSSLKGSPVQMHRVGRLGALLLNFIRERIMASLLSQLKLVTVALAVLLIPTWTTATAEGPLADFEAENSAAMAKMMAGMAITSSNDIDRDFVGMMIPHHQGAIDMAEAELRHGHSEQLRRIAQEIIVDQQQEIEAMKFALGDSVPAAMTAPSRPAAASLTSSQNPSPTNSEPHP